jgi:hypothetical protein
MTHHFVRKTFHLHILSDMITNSAFFSMSDLVNAVAGGIHRPSCPVNVVGFANLFVEQPGIAGLAEKLGYHMEIMASLLTSIC